MTNGINTVLIVGVLGADPDIRPTQNGNLCANMRVFTSESWWDKTTNSKKVKNTWHRVCAFDQKAITARNWLKKGDLVYIQGKMNYRDWQRNGITKTSAEIIASKIERLSTREDEDITGTPLPEPPESFDDESL